ncbi:MAG TPA: cobalamin B12-binding domain-containing protein [Gaiellaceae bacterium]|nr:cobalamin B12-binding domain-containing protein [Gaiellaceae bacterium]
MAAQLRIGELSRRTEVAPELLRAWERRYGLLAPSRSDGGYRLYSEDDVERVRAMQANLAAGLSAAEAARLAIEAPHADQPGARGASALAALREALDRFDGTAAHGILDQALSELSLDALLGQIVLPYLAELGARWERGEASIAQEHFASSLLRGRLLGLARGWDRGTGPRAVLACAPHELHDLPLIVFGLALRERGWRITYLGADTPLETTAEAARTLEPQLVVISASAGGRLNESLDGLRRLGRNVPLALAGPGAVGVKIATPILDGDPLTEADRVTDHRLA